MSNSNDNNGAMLGIAFAVAIATFAIAFIFAILVFASLVITALCIRAWHEPLTLFGQTITPPEAHEFVARGILGAIVVPAFALFASVLFNVRINPDFWLYLPLGGYALGSLVLGYYIEQAKAEAAEKEAAVQALLPPQPPVPPERMINAHPVAKLEEQPEARPQPFRFATWDDEEELQK